MTQAEELREKISEILVKWNMPTRQVAIDEILSLFSLVKQQERDELRKKIEGMKNDIPKCGEDCPFCGRGLYRKCNISSEEKSYNQALADLQDLLKE